VVIQLRQLARSQDRYSALIEAADGRRVRLVLPDLAVLRIGLRVGTELTPELASLVAQEAASVRAFDLAMRALARRPWARRELETMLRKRGAGAGEVGDVMTKLSGAGLLDDASFAAAFVRSRIATRGASVWLLRRDLARKGVARDVADLAISAVMADEEIDEDALARREARKKYRSLARLEPAVARRRLAAYLQRRGFSAGVVRTVVRELAVSGRSGGA